MDMLIDGEYVSDMDYEGCCQQVRLFLIFHLYTSYISPFFSVFYFSSQKYI